MSRASGGAGTASRRMSSERGAARTLAGVLAAAGTGGIRDVLRSIDLAELADRPVEQIYAALVDYVCPPDGTLDDAYARDAYLEAVVEITGGDADLEHPDEAVTRQFIAAFIANAVNHRVINAIANGLVSMPSDLEKAKAVGAGLAGFIRGCVDDALGNLGGTQQVEAFQSGIGATFERVIGFIGASAEEAAMGG